MALDATVQRLRNKDDDQRAVKQNRDAFVTQWREEVGAVYGQFEKALKRFVDDGAAKITKGQTVITEDLLGEYEIETLAIDIVGRRVLLVPQARITIGGRGRLDLYREDRPSEDNRILIVRGVAAADYRPDLWMIEVPRTPVSPLSAAFMSAQNLREGLKRKYEFLSEQGIQDGIDHVLNL